MSFFANAVGLNKEREMLKKMYASFRRDAGKMNLTSRLNNQSSQAEDNSGITGRCKKLRLNLYGYARGIDDHVMRPYFGGATDSDEEKEREEEMIEEEESLRIFAEQHMIRHGSQFGIDQNLDPNDNSARMFGGINEFNYMDKDDQMRANRKVNSEGINDEFIDIEIKEDEKLDDGI